MTLDAAEAYIVRGGLKPAGGIDPDETEAMVLKKARAELEKIEGQKLSIRLDREVKQGKYILRGEAIAQRVDQLTVIETHFRQILHTRMLQWCNALGREPEPGAGGGADGGC